MFLQLIFILFFVNSVLSQQGIFDPSSFAENSCSSTHQWTMWFDTNNPSLAQGDAEVTKHIQQLFAGFMCPLPTGIEAQTANGMNPTTTGDIFRITIKEGFLCINQQVNSFRNKLCANYRVRYCCPMTSS